MRAASTLALVAALGPGCGGRADGTDGSSGHTGGAGSGATGSAASSGAGGSAGSHAPGGAGGSGAAGSGAGGGAGAMGTGGGAAGAAGTAGVAAGGVGGAGATGTGGGPVADAGPLPDWATCSRTSDCVVRPASCCGDCGAATRGDAVGVNRHRVAAHAADACAPGEGCDACFLPVDPTLVARCQTGGCRVVDLLAQPLTECREDADCRLRHAACCECGAPPDTLVAVRADSADELVAILCDPGSACPECEPGYPEHARAECHGGRCTVTGSPATTPK